MSALKTKKTFFHVSTQEKTLDNRFQNNELSLSDLRRLIPKTAFETPTLKNLIGSLVKIGCFFAFFSIACLSNNIFITVLSTLIAGIWLFSLGTVGHDCGHGFHVKPRWLNELLGQICMIFHGLPYAGWKHSHNVHHANTNRGDVDPDRLWLYPDEYNAMPPLGRFFWRLFHTKCFWLSAFGHYFRSMLPWSFKIAEKTDSPAVIKECRLDILIFLSVLSLFHTSWFLAGFGIKSLIIHSFCIVLAFIGLSIYVRTEHYLLETGWDMHNKPWLTSRTVLQNKFLDFLATNLNYHVEHHVLQTISHANLPQIRPIIKSAVLKANEPYHEADFFEFLKLAFNKEFFVLERETFKEIPIKN